MGASCSNLFRNNTSNQVIQPSVKSPKPHTCVYAECFVENPLSPNSKLSKLKNIIEDIQDVNKKDKIGESLLFVACEKGHLEGVELLLQDKPKLNSMNVRGLTPLHIATIQNEIEIIKRLLDAKINVNHFSKDCMAPIEMAVLWGHLEIVKLLHEHGAKMDIKDVYGRSLIKIAEENNHKEVYEYLLSIERSDHV